MTNKINKKVIKFEGTIVRCICDRESYKAYAVDVDRNKYPDIKFTKYGSACINGDLHKLGEGIRYEIEAVEENGKNGYAYKVSNIKRNKPNNELDMQLFLSEILTQQQASTLYQAYPDIIDRVIQNKLDGIDLNKTKGIKEYTFNIIKQKIVENFCLVEIVTEFKGLLSLSMVKKLYEKYPSVQKIRYEMRINPYKCLCGLARIGFKTADNLLLEIDKTSQDLKAEGKQPIIDFTFDLQTSSQRCLACTLYLLDENENNGNTKMDIIELKHQVEKLVPACSNYFSEVIKDNSIYFNKDNREIALNSTYDIEKYIANSILEGLKYNTKWDYDYQKYQNSGDFPLSDEQINALKYLCSYNISILNGSGGTGKSQTTASIIKMLDDNNKSYNLFSPTGKAAKVLSEYTHREAKTIHRGLGYIPPSEWTSNQENKLYCDVLIIDEFSMVDIFLFNHVIDAIDFKITKLLIIGDNAQLSSVSCGNLLHDFMQSNIIPTTTLTKVFRYGDGGLMKIATDVRECKKYLDKDSLETCTFFGGNKDYAFINVNDQRAVKNVVALYKKLLTQGYTQNDIQVLTAYKKGEYGSIAINNHIQRIANQNYGAEGIKFGETTYYKGDIVIQNVNNYKAKIYVDDTFCFDEYESDETFIANGETGVVLDIGLHNMVIDFDGVKVIYDREALSTIGLGYSISIHKSQGSAVKVVILLTPKAHTYMLNSNLIYVGLTRMREKCFHIGNVDTVNTSIKKKENLNRLTFMQELLK